MEEDGDVVMVVMVDLVVDGSEVLEVLVVLVVVDLEVSKEDITDNCYTRRKQITFTAS
jgi:hypothetical protein